VILTAGIFHSAHSQMLNQDADGKSSIVWSGGAVGTDIAEGMVKANYYRFPIKGCGVVWGVDMQGENEEGFANLIKDGAFVPKGEFSGLIGGKKAFTHFYDGKGEELTRLTETKEAYAKQIEVLVKKGVEKEYDLLIDKIVVGCKEDGSVELKNTVVKKLKSFTDLVKRDVTIRVYMSTVEFEDCPQIVAQVESLIEALDKSPSLTLLDSLDRQRRALSIQIDKFDNDDSKNIKTTSMLLYYLRAGVGVTEFKYDLGDSLFNTVDSRFRDTVFVSAFGEIGLTYRYASWYFGISGGLSRAHNFSELEKEEYKFSDTDTTITQGSLAQSESFKAYEGKYGTYLKPHLNIDVVKMFTLKESNYLGLGLYVRSNFSTNKDLAKGNVVLGGAINFINGN